MPQEIADIKVTVDLSLLTELRNNLRSNLRETLQRTSDLDVEVRDFEVAYITQRITALNLVIDLIGDVVSANTGERGGK